MLAFLKSCLILAAKPAIPRCLQPHVEQLRKYTYGKHIASKVEAMLAAQAEAACADGEALPAALQGKAATAEGVMH